MYVTDDAKYDYKDMVAFALMWNWYNANNILAFANYEDQGEFIDIEAEHDSIYLDIPNSLSAYQIQINYQPGDVFINKGDTDQEKMVRSAHPGLSKPQKCCTIIKRKLFIMIML